MTDQDLCGVLIRLHVLHHAGEEPIFGLGIIAELRHHGYEISAGTLYPMLHGHEKKAIRCHDWNALYGEVDASTKSRPRVVPRSPQPRSK